MDTNHTLHVKFRKYVDQFGVRYYVEVDGEKIGWVDKFDHTGIAKPDEMKKGWSAHVVDPNGGIHGHIATMAEETRREAAAAVLSKCGRFSYEQISEWHGAELDRAYKL